MDKKTLTEFIRRNELDAFFKAASQMETASEDWHNELVLLERRFVELEDLSSDGVLSHEEASRQRNGISRDGMKLLEELDAAKLIHPAFPKVRKVKKSTLWLSLGAGLLAALLIWQFNIPSRQQEDGVKPTVNSEQSKPENKSNDHQTINVPDSKEKRSPTTQEQTKKSGVPLKVSGNNDKFDDEIAAFLTKVLLEKGIAAYPAAKGGNYASALDCRFSMDKTRASNDAVKWVITMTLSARNSDNVLCYTKRFTSEAQMLRQGVDETDALRRGLSSLRKGILSSGIKICTD